MSTKDKPASLEYEAAQLAEAERVVVDLRRCQGGGLTTDGVRDRIIAALSITSLWGPVVALLLTAAEKELQRRRSRMATLLREAQP